MANQAELLDLYHQMLLIRRFEEAAAEQYTLGKIGGFLHSYVGEEAVAVGALAELDARDHLFTSYRDHGWALARGCDPNAVMAELFGRATGVSKGRGGSMHLADVSRNFWGGYAIVGSQIVLATGMALAQQYKKTGAIVLCSFGDGATNGGEFHEGLNLAMLWKLPIVFLCENNLYGMGTTVARASSVLQIQTKATAYGMSARQVDGMEILAVREAVREAIGLVRAGAGPQFVEALTYRFVGHSMADPQLYRRKDEVEEWRLRDPIPHFEASLRSSGLMSDEQAQEIAQRVQQEVAAAVKFADESPFPAPDELAAYTYATRVQSLDDLARADYVGELVSAGR